MYLLRKVVCLSYLDLPIARKAPLTLLVPLGSLREYGCTQVVSYCLYLLNNFVIENSIKSKLKNLGEFGCTFGLVEKDFNNKSNFMKVNS
jgi:hypothetical protein